MKPNEYQVSEARLRGDLSSSISHAETWADSENPLRLLDAMEDIGRAEECISLLHRIGANRLEWQENKVEELRAQIYKEMDK